MPRRLRLGKESLAELAPAALAAVAGGGPTAEYCWLPSVPLTECLQPTTLVPGQTH